MIRTALAIIVVTTALALSACTNAVMSEQPWFGPPDSSDASPLKQGVWVFDKAETCRYDQRAPLERWPNCAQGFVLRQAEILTLGYSTPPTEYMWQSQSYILAAGEPRIGQHACSVLQQPRDAAAAEDALLAAANDARKTDSKSIGQSRHEIVIQTAKRVEQPEEERKFRYCYFALEPTASESGSITAVRFWPILCGPVDKDRTVTGRRFPGLRVVGSNCVAENITALRNAAKLCASLSQNAPPGRAHWVRDGYR